MEDHQRRVREAIREAIRTARVESERLRATVEQTKERIAASRELIARLPRIRAQHNRNSGQAKSRPP
jgi:hypothetical protein